MMPETNDNFVYPMRRESSGTSKPRQPNSSPNAAKQKSASTPKKSGINESAKSLGIFDSFKGAIWRSHADPYITKPPSAGRSTASRSQRALPSVNPNPLK